MPGARPRAPALPASVRGASRRASWRSHRAPIRCCRGCSGHQSPAALADPHPSPHSPTSARRSRPSGTQNVTYGDAQAQSFAAPTIRSEPVRTVSVPKASTGVKRHFRTGLRTIPGQQVEQLFHNRQALAPNAVSAIRRGIRSAVTAALRAHDGDRKAPGHDPLADMPSPPRRLTGSVPPMREAPFAISLPLGSD